LVNKRNDAVHDGRDVDPVDCAAAIEVAAAVVEHAFPLPGVPETTGELLWGKPNRANMYL